MLSFQRVIGSHEGLHYPLVDSVLFLGLRRVPQRASLGIKIRTAGSDHRRTACGPWSRG